MDKNFISKFLKGSASASIGQIATIAFHFFSIMLLSRYVPKEEFGIYFLVLAIVQFLKIIGSLGLDLTLVKFISDETGQKRNSNLTAVLLLRAGSLTVLALMVYTLGHLLFPYLDESVNQYIFFIPIIFISFSYRELFFYLLQGLQLFKKFAIVQVVSAVMKFGFILLALQLNELHLETLFYIEVATYVLSIVIQIMVIPFKQAGVARPDGETVRALMKFGTPLYLNSILTFGYDRTSVFLIGAFLNPASIAYYEIASKIPQACLRMFQSFIVVLFPNLSKLFSEGKKVDAEKLLNRSMTIFSVAIMLGVLISFCFRNEIIGLMFSENYVPASMAFVLLMLNFQLRALSNIMGYSIVSAGHPSVPAKANTVTSIISITGCIFMLPKFGYMGAVYALLIMHVASQIIYYIFLVKADIHVNALSYLKPIFIVFLLVGAYFLVERETLLLKIGLIISYLVICFLVMNEFRLIVNYALRMIQDYKWSSKSA